MIKALLADKSKEFLREFIGRVRAVRLRPLIRSRRVASTFEILALCFEFLFLLPNFVFQF